MNATDTNVLVYAFDNREVRKQALAIELLDRQRVERETVLMWQVAGEFLNQLLRFERQELIDHSEVEFNYSRIRRLFPLAMPTPGVLDKAIELRPRHSLSHWDSMLVAACQTAGVATLYTEDMGSPRRIDDLELVNPFS